MTDLNTNLNTNEQAVLNDLIRSSAGNGHDFGFTDEVSSVSRAQVGGYVASLQTKGWITCNDDPDFGLMFEISPAAREYIGI